MVSFNRKMRRQMAKKNQIDHGDLAYIQDETKKKAINDSVNVMIASALLTLRDEFGFGSKRAQRFMVSVQDRFDAVEKGYLSLSDMTKTIEEELLITFETKDKG